MERLILSHLKQVRAKMTKDNLINIDVVSRLDSHFLALKEAFRNVSY